MPIKYWRVVHQKSYMQAYYKLRSFRMLQCVMLFFVLSNLLTIALSQLLQIGRQFFTIASPCAAHERLSENWTPSSRRDDTLIGNEETVSTGLLVDNLIVGAGFGIGDTNSQIHFAGLKLRQLSCDHSKTISGSDKSIVVVDSSVSLL